MELQSLFASAQKAKEKSNLFEHFFRCVKATQEFEVGHALTHKSGALKRNVFFYSRIFAHILFQSDSLELFHTF